MTITKSDAGFIWSLYQYLCRQKYFHFCFCFRIELFIAQSCCFAHLKKSRERVALDMFDTFTAHASFVVYVTDTEHRTAVLYYNLLYYNLLCILLLG